MKSEASLNKTRLPEEPISILENIIGCELGDISDGSEFNHDSIKTLLTSFPTNSLEEFLSPQWVVLAAGKGTRIDPTGRFSKTLDVMFGEENMLHRSCRFLPGKRPRVVVINPRMAKRIENSRAPEELIGSNAIYCIQEQMNGTGGALQAAIPILIESDAEWVGVAFGDEPFLNRDIFSQTLLSHLITRADVTLCGKIPDTVVDKGGLFYDENGKFIGTKEWYDMTENEQTEMWHRLERGEAYTNTGITIISKNVMLERINRLQPHTNKNGELHHVDLVRLCYQDGLKTNAFIYHGEVLSGVNRWSNVLVGEDAMFKQTRDLLAKKGVRVDPAAQTTIECEDVTIGVGCYLIGRNHIGKEVKIGNYCRLENVILTGKTAIGDSVGLQNVSAADTTFISNQLPQTLSQPISGIRTESDIKYSSFNAVVVGRNVQLSNIKAHATIIPSEIRLENNNLGVPNTDSPLGVQRSLFKQIIRDDYKPGVYTFGEKKGLPDWDNLRNHVRSHSAKELIPRSTSNSIGQQDVSNAINMLLDMKCVNGEYLIESLTPEELWGTIFEMVKLYTGNLNPYHQDKLKARQTALSLLPEFWNEDWLTRLKLVVAGNVIDFSSARVVEKINANPDYFSQALRAAVETPFAIDCFDIFQEKVIDASSQMIIWLADNDGEIIFDYAFIKELIKCGHRICIVGKENNASNDVSLQDLHDILDYPQFQDVQNAYKDGIVSLISSGAKTIGTNLNNATPEFINVLLEADFVISKGQGNFFTTPGWNKHTFYLFMSKGMTAENCTGVVADKNLPIDGLILSYLPAGTKRDTTLKHLCNF